MKEFIIDILEPGIARLTLSQPARRNALNAGMWAALPRLLGEIQGEIQSDKNLRALIITGAGNHFSAGADISEFETLYATPESATKISADIQQGFNALAAVTVPDAGLRCAATLELQIRPPNLRLPPQSSDLSIPLAILPA